MDNEIPRGVIEDDCETRMKLLVIGALCIPLHLTPVLCPDFFPEFFSFCAFLILYLLFMGG